ncbi:MAG: hypothetical protein IJH75_00725 [Mogibacterium sp.]|nr:hypothetical protein [Mogibacterium sp.]
MKYGDKIIRMEGIIVEVHDGSIAVDLKGRLGYLRVPKRMVISDYDLKVGQTVAWNMSFIEQEGPEVNEKYFSNIDKRNKVREEMLKAKQENNEEE